MAKTKKTKIEVHLDSLNMNDKQAKKFAKDLHQFLADNLPTNNVTAPPTANVQQGTININFDFFDADRSLCSGTATCNGITKSLVGTSNTINFSNVTTGNSVFVNGFNPGAKTTVTISGLTASPQRKNMTNTHFGFASLIQ